MEYPDFTSAACRGLDVNMFFMTDETSSGPSRILRREILPSIRAMCKTCPVVETCLEWALKHEKHGIWAGTTEKERDAIRVKTNIKYEDIAVAIPLKIKYGK